MNDAAQTPKRTLPAMAPERHACYSPHVVLLGAGASLAAFPDGDANGRRLPLMMDFVETLGLNSLLEDQGIEWRGRNFEDIYSRLVESGAEETLVRDLENEVYEYFRRLALPEEVTLYDELLLSLRPKDLVATFNWDPFLLQAYARNADIGRLPRIVFLHGNVKVGVCERDRVKGHFPNRCGRCGQWLKPVPLLYPIAEKDYQTDPFIRAEWDEFSAFLEDAYLLTIFGYGAPTTDVAAVSLMRQVWERNTNRELAQISIVDTKEKGALQETWRPFFVRDHYGIASSLDGSQLFTFPRRSCDAFMMASLQLSPCKPNPLPRLTALDELRTWVRPLVAEEIAEEKDGTPFSC